MSESPPVEAWFDALIERARAFDGQPPFSDQSLVDLRTGARELIAIEHVAAAVFAGGEAEFVVDPDARGRGNGTALLEILLSNSPGGLLVWAHGDHPAARALAASHGLTPVRELLHLAASLDTRSAADGAALLDQRNLADRVDVHLAASLDTRSATDGAALLDQRNLAGRVDRDEGAVVSRPLTLDIFRVGVDEDEWVALNALTFASHAEQGSVTRADLEQLEAERWFSADNFLVLREDGAMIGYCWLKVDDAGGEFYVVGVHPGHQGEKLGSALFDAGLGRLRELGIRRAHLYVEGDNEPALRLYRARGFTQDSIDVQYASSPQLPELGAVNAVEVKRALTGADASMD